MDIFVKDANVHIFVFNCGKNGGGVALFTKQRIVSFVSC